MCSHTFRALPIASVMTSATIYTVVQGLTYPLLALRLNERGTAEWMVGVNAAMMPAGMLAAAAIAPRLVGMIGLYRTCILSLSGVCILLLALGVLDNYWAWIPLRFLTGALLSCIFVVTDTWVNHLVDDRYRGRTLGIYSMLLSIGFAVGPTTLSFLGRSGLAPFLVGASLPLVAIIPLLLARKKLRDSITSEAPASVLAFVWRAPTILACVMAAAFADQAAMSLLPIYALQVGYGERLASLSLTAMIVGSIALMFPIGWAADRYSRTYVTIACAVATAILSLAIQPLASHLFSFFATIFLWGGICYAIYTLGLVKLGQQFSGADLVAGSAACGATWGVGGLIGTPLAGAAMGKLGSWGFPTSMAIAFGILSAVLLMSQKRSCHNRTPPSGGL